MRARAILFGCVLAGAALAPRAASADMGPKWEHAVFLPIGLNLGAALHPNATSGFLFGGEISALYIDSSLRWIGGYVDTLHDFGADKTRFSVGPELGWGPFGFDAGYVGQLGQGRYHHGFNARLVLSLAFVGIYGRYTHIFDDPLQPNFGEVGALLKFPIPLFEKRQDRRPYIESPPPAPPPEPPAAETPALPVAPVPEEAPATPREFATPPPAPVAPVPPKP